MKILVRVEKDNQNRIEFDAGQSDLSYEDMLKTIITVAQECLKNLNADR